MNFCLLFGRTGRRWQNQLRMTHCWFTLTAWTFKICAHKSLREIKGDNPLINEINRIWNSKWKNLHFSIESQLFSRRQWCVLQIRIVAILIDCHHVYRLPFANFRCPTMFQCKTNIDLNGYRHIRAAFVVIRCSTVDSIAIQFGHFFDDM